ncbi:MAG: hypothetical protein KC561_08670, partial [Myxococcales bacterium]|nr:hypothetical protein [Myxococcales bacterium]
PDEEAYFSETDIASAVFDTPETGVVERNPGVEHLVVSVKPVSDLPTARVSRLYAFDQGERAFRQVGEFDENGAET